MNLRYRYRIFCILVVLLATGVTGCFRPANRVASANVDHWTCTMHPSVQSRTPGKCPICGMDLVAVEKSPPSSSETSDPSQQREITGPKVREFTVPVARQQQIGVTYSEVRRRDMRFGLRAIGTLQPDQALSFDYVVRLDGYIDELHVISAGEQVHAGQPLMTIYSPDLRAPEQELVNLLKVQQNGNVSAASLEQLIETARRRLRFLNVASEEISKLEQTSVLTDLLVFRSPFDGIVDQAPMKVGMSVKRGDKLMSVLNLSRLWLWLSFYENDLVLLKEGQKIAVTLESFPNRAFSGTVRVISPTIDPVKRTGMVRIDISNPTGELRPGMYANAVAEINAGEGLTVPVQSVLPVGSRMLVFVDKGAGKLEPRFIHLGRQLVNPAAPDQDESYEVKAGLAEGERVVSSANFLIDAESQIQGAIQDWTEPADLKTEVTPDRAKTTGNSLSAPALPPTE